ncbi:hypothetical protein ANCCEY_13860 [Ancylostoma ceylanicum]|uniref:Uncharacterized protein n=1 Tax=Ancylostoma ceylanicum TaxID=53326 RepID=A0A0D6LHB3_9BILA|nr:hypothetical protein ANCCEY_13860 [Ancylostoma ceylanicum]
MGHSISSDVRMTGFRLGCGGKKDKLSPPGAKPTALVDEVSAPRGFGIRSYLHNFYLSPTVEDIEQSGAWYLLPPPPAQRRGLFICRLCTVIGLLLLIGGAVSIVVGYTWPHEGVEQSIYKIVIYELRNCGSLPDLL